jgi:hypothetical protein
MSPQGYGITTTYKTRVATQKPCKEYQGILIGQVKDRRPDVTIYFCSLCSFGEERFDELPGFMTRTPAK